MQVLCRKEKRYNVMMAICSLEKRKSWVNALQLGSSRQNLKVRNLFSASGDTVKEEQQSLALRTSAHVLSVFLW